MKTWLSIGAQDFRLINAQRPHQRPTDEFFSPFYRSRSCHFSSSCRVINSLARTGRINLRIWRLLRSTFAGGRSGDRCTRDWNRLSYRSRNQESALCADRVVVSETLTEAPKSDVWPLRKLSRSLGCLHSHIS